MAEIFKSLSKLGIRLSVELSKNDLKNVLKIVPVTSADRPCMFFIMGEGGRIVQKVRSVFTFFPMFKNTNQTISRSSNTLTCT